MNIYVVISSPEGYQNTAAAFSSKDKALEHIEGEEIPDASVTVYEVNEEPEPDRIHAAHTLCKEGVYQLEGFYLQKFKAKLATGEDGYVKLLIIDQPDPEAPSLYAPVPSDRDSRSPVIDPSTGKVIKDSTVASQIGDSLGDQRNVVVLSWMICLLVLVRGFLYYNEPKIQFVEHVDAVEWLPPEASDISYYIVDDFRSFEFKISENGFLDWVKKEQYQFEEITGEPVKLPRYTFDADIPVELSGLNDQERFEKWELVMKVIIEAGYVLKARNDDGDPIDMGGYDRESGYAYYRYGER